MESNWSLKVKRISEHAVIPTKGTPQSAGYDLYSTIRYTLLPWHRKAIDTGIAIELPDYECYGRISPRSGLAVRYGIDVMAGIIDKDYRGEIKVILINCGNTPFEIKKGDRVAQIIIERTIVTDIVEVNELTVTERSNNGFGSTGR